MASTRVPLILYGSQTGTAEDVAWQIARECYRWRLKPRIVAMDDYDITRLVDESIVVFVAATTGQGDTPDNMKRFWRFLLRKSLPSNLLVNLDFTVFGLGDSSYGKYNFVAKRLYRRLLQLGAQEFYRRGLGDDQHQLGLDGELIPWLQGLVAILLSRCSISADVSPLPQYTLHAPRYQTAMALTSHSEAANPPSESTMERSEDETGCYSARQPFMATLKATERLTAAGHWQDVRLFTFETRGSLRYSPGDVLMIQPQNMPDLVQEFLNYFELQGDARIILLRDDPEMPWPTELPEPGRPITLRELAEKYWDFCAVPRRSFFQLLSHFATDDREKERLRELAMPENLDEYFDYATRMRRTALETLHDFPSCQGQVPVSYLFDLFPALKPRAFSIASSQEKHPNQVSICVALVEYRTKMAMPRRGVCSAWLGSLSPGARVPVWTVPGTITLPKDSTVPLIMVGPGTGVAPFRSFIEERAVNNMRAGLLFFGCRGQATDYLFQEDWQEYSAQGLLEIEPAFSRDQDHKVYVQHKIREHGAKIWDLLTEHNAIFYICGNAKRMPDDVRSAVIAAVQEHGKLTLNEAEDLLTRLEKVGRWQLETWS